MPRGKYVRKTKINAVPFRPGYSECPVCHDQVANSTKSRHVASHNDDASVGNPQAELTPSITIKSTELIQHVKTVLDRTHRAIVSDGQIELHIGKEEPAA